MSASARLGSSIADMAGGAPAEPPADCALCPRLVAYREANHAAHPDWFNGAVPSFGAPDARLLIVGLAPGVTGANRTGRPFTGDFAGDLLYDTLDRFNWSRGAYAADPSDGLALAGAMITNAVRCVPPENKPTGAEISACRPHLAARILATPGLEAILCLGKIAHDAVIRVFGARLSAHPFGHGARHEVGGVRVYDSYHCSRYNTNTGRLTPEMFQAVFTAIAADLAAGSAAATE